MSDPRGPKVGKLSDLVRLGQYLSITCENRDCLHRGTLDPAELIERFGRDVSVEAINRAAYCSKCRRRDFHMQALNERLPFSPGYEV